MSSKNALIRASSSPTKRFIPSRKDMSRVFRRSAKASMLRSIATRVAPPARGWRRLNASIWYPIPMPMKMKTVPSFTDTPRARISASFCG